MPHIFKERQLCHRQLCHRQLLFLLLCSLCLQILQLHQLVLMQLMVQSCGCCYSAFHHSGHLLQMRLCCDQHILHLLLTGLCCLQLLPRCSLPLHYLMIDQHCLSMLLLQSLNIGCWCCC